MVWDILGPILAAAFLTLAGGSIKMLVTFNKDQQKRHEEAIDKIWEHLATTREDHGSRISRLETIAEKSLPAIEHGIELLNRRFSEHFDMHK